MKITIIGSGNVASALGQGWMRSGHEIIFGVRDIQSPKALKLAETVPGVRLESIEDACREAGAIVITTPPEAVTELVPKLGDISGKILIDATNSIRNRPEPFPTAFHAIKGLTGHEDVVKCFNTTGFENMLNPVYPQSGGIDMFAAGNSQQAKAVATQLATDLGFGHCYDFGGDDRVELLEKLAFCWINLAILQGNGRNIAFKVVHR